MKTYIVMVNGEQVFSIGAKNTREAKKIATKNKRRQGIKGVTSVRLDRN